MLCTGLSLTYGNAQAVTMFPAVALGIKAVISPRFTKGRVWDVCRRYGCTSYSLLGGVLSAMYAEPPRPDDASHVVERVISAGTPAASWEPLERLWRERFVASAANVFAKRNA